MKSARSFWLLCVCCFAELTVFAVISFGQTLPASQQLRLLQPNGKERLQSGSEYTIKWTGIDSARPVRLEYSINGGKSWKRITDRALGGSYLWKPIPNEPSDSCLILATGLEADSTEGVGRSLVQFQVPRSLNNGYTTGDFRNGESVTFNADGTKILVSSLALPPGASNAIYGWWQQNLEVRDGKTGAVLFTLPTYNMDTTNHKRNYFWTWPGYSDKLIKGGQGRWSPDGRLLLAQTTDTSFGLYDAHTGGLVRNISVPSAGNATRCMDMRWTAKGQEILATVQHRFFNVFYPQGDLDTVRIMMMRFNTSTGALTNTPFRVSVGMAGSAGCTGGWWHGLGNISNDGERRLAFANDSNSCFQYNNTIIRSTRDNAVIATTTNLPNLPYSWLWERNSSVWSPNDSLIVFYDSQPNTTVLYIINTYNGLLVQRIENAGFFSGSYANITWSPDSKRIVFDGSNTSYNQSRFIADIRTGAVQPTLRNTPIINDVYYGWGWSGVDFSAASGNSTSTWSPDSRFIAGFLWQARTQRNNIDNVLNTVGIWDAKTGCLLQTFRLPFPDSLNSDQKRSFFFHTTTMEC